MNFIGKVGRTAVLLASVLLTTIVPSASANCTHATRAQTGASVASFIARPAGLLERFPGGDGDLAQQIALIVSADPLVTMEAAANLVRIANPRQRHAVGRGLGLAARACQVQGQLGAARRIQDTLRARSDRDSLTGFIAAVSEGTLEREPPAVSVTTLGESRSGLSSPDTPVFGPRPLGDPLKPITPIR